MSVELAKRHSYKTQYNPKTNEMIEIIELSQECMKLMRHTIFRALCDAACITGNQARDAKDAGFKDAMDAWVWFYGTTLKAVQERASIVELAGLDAQEFENWIDKLDLPQPTRRRVSLYSKKCEARGNLLIKFRLKCSLELGEALGNA